MAGEASVAVVTGASSGIGRSIATHLAGAGLRVVGSRLPNETEDSVGGEALLPLNVDIDESGLTSRFRL